jgi:hypothetical protein
MSVPNISKLRLGPANIYLTENAVSTYVGGTAQIDITVKQTWADLMCDQLGTQAANKVLVGVEAYCEFVFREIDLKNFSRALAATKSYIDDVDASKRRVEVYPRVGIDLATLARTMVIKPLVGGVETTDKEQWITADKAAPDTETAKWAYAASGQRDIPARFYFMPDGANNNRLFYMGEPVITDSSAPIGFVGIW